MIAQPRKFESPIPKLLLSAEEAAASLSVCPKTIWTLSAPRGTLPCVRIGRRVMYSPTALAKWIEEQQEVSTAIEQNHGPAGQLFGARLLLNS